MNMTRLCICVLPLLALSYGCGFLPALLPQPTPDDAGSAAVNTDSEPILDIDLFMCGLTNCTCQLISCMLDPACREALVCHAQCGSGGLRSDQQACHLACQLAQGGGSEIYDTLIQCFADNGCLPTLPADTDGRCLVSSDNIHQVHVLASLDEIAGTWREIRGLNCGVSGSNWEGGYDSLPCRSSSWVYRAQQWWYHTSFCAPTDNGGCGAQEPVHLIAAPSLSDREPGLLEVPYTNPPLKPQHERWYILSRPHPDWVMYTYCGSTPIGEYAGVNIMTRASDPSDAAMPADVEAAFRQAADNFGFSYDEMCVTDQSECPPVTAEEDVQDWIDGL